MSDLAISVTDLGKRYRIGGRQQRHETFMAALSAALASPFRRLRNLGKPVPRDELFWALRGVSFDLKSGEVLGIIGRNGAGKSTLLKLLSRITEPTEGRMEIHGRLGSLLEVGTGFHPELTGRENIYLNGTILGMKRREVSRKFDEIVEFSGIQRFLDTPVKRYSSGMYVRLAFAVAAHLEPEILVVDEVLAVGDVEFQKKCLGKMSEVASAGRTILFVSHNMAAIKTLCTRAMLVHEGRVAHDGDVDETVARYLDLNSPIHDNGVVGDDAPRIGNGHALLRRVEVRDCTGAPTAQITLGQRFKIATLFDVKQPLRTAFVEIGISTIDGLRVATLQNIDEARPTFSLEPGLNEIVAEIDATFLPRDYVIDVVIGDLSGAVIDWVDRTFRFTALNVASNSSDHYRWSEVRGFLRPKSVWHSRRTEN